MEAEEVDVGEVPSDWRVEVILVYLLEDEVEIFLDVDGNWAWTRSINILIESAFKTGTLVAAGMEDGGADVAREGIGLGGWWRWGVSLGGDWLCVELFDDVDVEVINRGNQGGGGCSCNVSAESVRVCCFLGG